LPAAGPDSSRRSRGPRPRLSRSHPALGSNGRPFLSSLLTYPWQANRTPGCEGEDDPVGVGAPPPKRMEPISLSGPRPFSVARCRRATAKGGGSLPHPTGHFGATPLDPHAANPLRPRLPLGKPLRHAGHRATTPIVPKRVAQARARVARRAGRLSKRRHGRGVCGRAGGQPPRELPQPWQGRKGNASGSGRDLGASR